MSSNEEGKMWRRNGRGRIREEMINRRWTANRMGWAFLGCSTVFV